MKRIALLAAAVFGSGCVVSESPGVGGVNVYWTFQHLDSTGTYQPLNCAQARVDTVRLDFSDGTANTVPCSQGGVDGVNVGNFLPGSYWVAVTGYRNGVAVALYTTLSSVSFYVYAGSDAIANATVPGIWSDLTLSAALFDCSVTPCVQYAFPSCGTANVNYLTYVVRDGFGISLAQGQVPCPSTEDPPSISFTGSGGIDKDTLSIRMQGWQTGVINLVLDSCTVSFNHFGNDVALIDIDFPIPSPCP